MFLRISHQFTGDEDVNCKDYTDCT